jgi:hypothetical protein
MTHPQERCFGSAKENKINFGEFGIGGRCNLSFFLRKNNLKILKFRLSRG